MRYGGVAVLHDLDLSIYPGEIMVIMGRSGSGKTTLLRLVLGLERPSAGVIRIMGKDLSRMSGRELYHLRTRMGVAFQNNALLASMDVAANVQLPLREHTRLDEATIRIMGRMKLELVNLGGVEGYMPAELSGGMLKRAALARAVVMDPKLLFFDEPSAGLDPVVAAEIDELVLRLRDALQTTVVIVTHDLMSAFKIADRIAILDAGRIAVTGTVEQIRASTDPRIVDMLKRRPHHERPDPEAYLERLTAGVA